MTLLASVSLNSAPTSPRIFLMSAAALRGLDGGFGDGLTDFLLSTEGGQAVGCEVLHLCSGEGLRLGNISLINFGDRQALAS